MSFELNLQSENTLFIIKYLLAYYINYLLNMLGICAMLIHRNLLSVSIKYKFLVILVDFLLFLTL